MKFLSTRGKDCALSAAEAIVKGLAFDGGLYVPETFPDLSGEIKNMLDASYSERALKVIGSFLTEYDQKSLLNACESAYSRFEESDPAPIVRLDEDFYVAELFHGPTLAFKDVALTLLPYLLRAGANIAGVKEEILILVATSGDTGKAALEGFKDAKGIKICVFYPTGGVSEMQKKQMSVQEGENVKVCAVKGNFDDCQTAVKNIFSDKAIEAELKNIGVVLSSANSINFGRLVPQIVYYFSAYCDLVSSGEIELGDKVNFCVPTGNFGNILAGYYAKKMGLPVGKLVCASNQNNVLTEFFANGEYDANREFFKTSSPSMDILVSSNLERLIFELSGRDADITASRMSELKKYGKYSVSDKEKAAMDALFKAGYSDESECAETIFNVFEEYGYVLDPHTAVAVKTFYDVRHELEGKTVVLSTASPYKFPQSVLAAITGKKISDAFKAARELNNVTAAEIPQGITELENKKVRFNEVIDKKNLFEAVKSFVLQ